MHLFLSTWLVLSLSLSLVSTVWADCSIRIDTAIDASKEETGLGEIHAAAVDVSVDCESIELVIGDKHLTFDKITSSSQGTGRARRLSNGVKGHWEGSDEMGEIFDFIINDEGLVYGTYWDLEDNGTWCLLAKDGKQIAEFFDASDFPEGNDDQELLIGGGNMNIVELVEDPNRNRKLVDGKPVPQDLHLAGPLDQEFGNTTRPQLISKNGVRGAKVSVPDPPMLVLEEEQPISVKSMTRDLAATVVIDIIVAWTSRTECLCSFKPGDCTPDANTEKNMRSIIDRVISETNTAFANSGTGVEFHLVHAYRTEYTEPALDKRFSTALKDFTYTGDGKMDEIHQKRTQYGADMGVLLIDNTGSNIYGLAWRPVYTSDTKSAEVKKYMFSVAGHKGLFGSLTMAHELGHNMGLQHDRNNVKKITEGYNYGYQDPGLKFRTIMAYQCPTKSCMTIPYFSSTTVKYNGMNIGDSQHDNTRLIIEVKERIAGMMATVPSCSADSGCNDNKACTIDTCKAGRCSFEPDLSKQECIPPSTLETTFSATTRGPGSLFKVTAKNHDVEVRSLTVHLMFTHKVEVLTKVPDGNFNNFVEVLNKNDVSTFGQGAHVSLPEFDPPIKIPAGKSRWFWVRSNDAGGQGGNVIMTSSEAQIDTVYKSNADLSIHEGYIVYDDTGTSASSKESTLVWNGAVNYVKASTSTTSTTPKTSAPVVTGVGLLSTTFAGTDFQNQGIAFKITAKKDMVITSLDFLVNVAGTHTITIFNKEYDGNFNGFQYAFQKSVTTSTKTVLELPAKSMCIPVSAGASQLILVNAGSAKVGLTPTTSTTPVENTDLSIHPGNPVNGDSLSSSLYVFNGIVRYDTPTYSSLSTTFANPTFQYNEATFKITAKKDVLITSLEMQLSSTGSHKVTVYSKEDDGSYGGFQPVYSGSVTGSTTRTVIPPNSFCVSVAAGKTQLFLVECSTAQVGVTPTTSMTPVENTQLSIYPDKVVGSDGYLHGTFTFNGKVHYSHTS